MWCSEVTCSLIRRCFCLHVHVHVNPAAVCSMFLHNTSMKTVTLTHSSISPLPLPFIQCVKELTYGKSSNRGSILRRQHTFFFCPAKLPRSTLLSGYNGRCVKPQSCDVLRMDGAIPTLTICQHCLPRDSYDHTRSHAELVY